jgi:benzoyl-CoA 2,3-dioxygenase component B
VSLDLFGSERSTNAANYYAAGLKGRFGEQGYDDDHVLLDLDDTYLTVADGAITDETMTARGLVNHELRSEYTADCDKGVRRWNRVLAESGVDHQFRLPHVGFNRRVGAFRGHSVSPDGQLLTDDEWGAASPGWLPSDAERAHVASLMQPSSTPGTMAGWIAPPATGINTRPVDYEYVRI